MGQLLDMISDSSKGVRLLICITTLFMISACTQSGAQSSGVNEMASTSYGNTDNDVKHENKLTIQDQYKIQVGDLLDIRFFYNPELNIELPVRPDGRLSLPLIQDVTVVGLSPVELSGELEKKYSGELQQSQITVIVRSFAEQKIYVTGEVSRPGVIAKTGGLTVLQAISQSGGLSKIGSFKKIKVIRHLENGNATVFDLNLQDVIDGTDITQDITLLSGDIVHVAEQTW